jgi:hypothetical protein
VDGALRTTLRGDDIVPRFLAILDEYVEQRYRILPALSR